MKACSEAFCGFSLSPFNASLRATDTSLGYSDDSCYSRYEWFGGLQGANVGSHFSDVTERSRHWKAVGSGATSATPRTELRIVLLLGSLRSPAHRLNEFRFNRSIQEFLPLEKRVTLSKLHGDKARFHRIRKRNIARKAMVRALRLNLAVPASGTEKTAQSQAEPLRRSDAFLSAPR